MNVLRKRKYLQSSKQTTITLDQEPHHPKSYLLTNFSIKKKLKSQQYRSVARNKGFKKSSTIWKSPTKIWVYVCLIAITMKP